MVGSSIVHCGLLLATGVGLCAAPAAQAQSSSEKQTEIRRLTVERFSVTSSRPFDDVIARVESSIGHPDMNTLRKSITAAQTEADLENVVKAALGPSGFMEFTRYDLGEVLRKESSSNGPRVVRLVIGNPLIMKEMVKRAPDAGSYAPVTILIDERPDGVHISYDRMASYLAPYKNEEALKVARELDAKAERLIRDSAF